MEILNVVLTALLSIVMLFVLTKLMGHRQIAQLELFDYIIGITIGSIAAELATELEKPLEPLIAMAVYGLVAIALNYLVSKHARMRKYISGTPSIIMNDGKLYRKNMRKAKLDLSEFLVMCRQAGYFDLSAIQTAIFEFNGKMTFLPVASKRPATPEDMGMTVQREHIFTEVIMDGRIIEANIQRMGRDIRWLNNQLKSQGYTTASDVFLGLCDTQGNLSLYGMKT